ncbi:AAC(3) family N-acetyltransferase, partial [Salmonella enterica]|uniref:AAC(3) family N-acetyltransferase n=1 Tax=Salmonella enterica TaxID=28901 RepID=UPI00398C3B1B
VGAREGGELGRVGALWVWLGPGGTLVMPSGSGLDDEPFDPATSPVTPDLGVVSDTFLRLPNVKRSAHPFAFAAAGPQAEQIISYPFPLPPHSPASPVARFHESAWQVLLTCVGPAPTPTPHIA